MRKLFLIFICFFSFLGIIYSVSSEFDYNSDDLSDYFGTIKACTKDGSSNDCRNGNEYKFYLKMYDLYFLYKNKYNIKLDLPLIMATLYFNHEELPTVFAKNLNSYDRNSLKNSSTITNLDWEYDFKKDSCYTYLNANDNSFDMQILAKNMVKKTTKYKCKKNEEENDDSDSNKEYEVEDIEKSNYSTETLKCDEGEYDKDSITESYKKDEEKYKDFLLEYIKLKYHTPGEEIKSCSSAIGGNVSGTGSIVFNGDFAEPDNDTPSGVYKLDGEPKPWLAINYWSHLNKDDYVYPKDSETGLLLGAWPKDYKNIPAQLTNYKVYKGVYIWPATPTDDTYQFVYSHLGIDVMADFGTPIYSPVDGELVYSEWGGTVNRGSDETSYTVTIKPDIVYNYNGTNVDEIFMTHMSGIIYRCSWGKCNRKLKKGELIGFVGTAAGDSYSAGYASHVHITFYPAGNYSGGLYTSAMEDIYEISPGTKRKAGE